MRELSWDLYRRSADVSGHERFSALGEDGDLERALARAGEDERVRTEVMQALRGAEARAQDPATFRLEVRWPLTVAMLSKAGTHQVRLANGLVFEVGLDSRIEQAILLSSEAHPDHVWEPQTTRLIQALAKQRHQAIVGGAYIGDHALFLAKAVARHGGGKSTRSSRWSSPFGGFSATRS